ncbi:hypothetical protein [Herbiconiux sp. L3-i23]|uniref:hypothetical protein n=1 Tax=Herbiconiux sp. L3-i23 TaxID=2905871 RepID=UPI002051F703|nr:hypothetical protein [Herbiconiux sp. L3-i23]BDI23145.1 hypothetical protein L3i23_19210 [Herbiconiux sp. L3-i23]
MASANQPRSRREARDAERRAQAEARETGDLSGIPAGEHPSGAFDLNASGGIWDSISRRAASQLTDAATEAERRTGRRVADQDREGSVPPEPLSYVTQGRPNIPTYEGPAFARRPQAPTAADVQAGFRERSFAPAAAASAPLAPASVGGLDYHTQTRTPPLRSAAPAAPEAPAAEATALDHTLTRRELREMRESGVLPAFSAADLAPRPGGWAAAPAPSVAPPVGHREPAPETPIAGIPLGSAFAAFEDTATAPMSAVDRAALIAEEPVLPKASPIAEAIEVVEPVAAAPLPVRSAPVVEDEPEAAEPAPFSDEPITGLQGFEALIAQASAGLDAPSVPATGPQQIIAPQPVEVPKPASQSTGHWSLQVEEDDDDLTPFDGLLSRNVGTSSGSTNALIMPTDPQPDLIHALNSTGEILVTGSLDLPRSLSSTGANSDHYDSSEIDRLFEASQEEHHNADVAPVRAARAVSTHTSTRSVVSPRKRRGGTLPVVLAVVASAMGLGVIGLWIASWITGTL